MIELPAIPRNKYNLGCRIAFLGKMAVGKTFQANVLVEEYGYQKLSFAGRLKDIASDLFGVSSKDGRSRAVLQGLGSKMREIDENVWIGPVANAIHELVLNQGTDIPIVIDDVRYPNEFNYLESNGFLMVRVYCSESVRESRIKRLYPNTSKQELLHASEILLDNFKPHTSLESDSGINFPDLDRLVYWGREI